MTQPLLARFASEPLAIDGDLSKPQWAAAEWSPRFVDMATGGPAILGTEAAVLWDEANLYVGFKVQEPYPNGKLTERDSLIFQENDVELFIDGGDCYYEFEINALGTIYEVFFIWRDAYEKFEFYPEFSLSKALTFGGDFDRRAETFWKGTHPRGLRYAFLDFDMPGLKSEVRVNGTLNDTSVVSDGWTVEMSIPWESLAPLANGRSLPPKDGDEWGLFLGRFQKIAIGEDEVQAAWCATPHGVYDTHQPNKFTRVVMRR